MAAGAALLGWTIPPLVGAGPLLPLVGVAGLTALVAGAALSSRRVRAKVGWLPARSQMAALWSDVLDLRSRVKAARSAGAIQRSEWDWQIAELETRLWAELKRILPDDWRLLQRSQVSFAVANKNPHKDDAAWGYEMMQLLESRLKMLQAQMDHLRK
jgi:hypothetical protein